ncbi:MAG: hypothetical protein DMF52_14425 [Acidobacteria bacterium]|nr:MAG: hypothetical protein DMF52_14425 [Acidobacteriota bacterium]
MFNSAFGPGSVVVAYVQNPRERFWGMIRALDSAGVVIEGIDLNSFDDWVRQVAEGGEGLSLSTVFIPLLRVEKLLLDANSGSAPSLSLQFETRVGRPLREHMGWTG